MGLQLRGQLLSKKKLSYPLGQLQEIFGETLRNSVGFVNSRQACQSETPKERPVWVEGSLAEAQSPFLRKTHH